MMMNNGNLKARIIATLAYADVFDYPLTKSEIFDWLLFASIKDKDKLERELKIVAEGIKKNGEEYWFLPGREQIVRVRLKREKYAENKYKIVEQIGKWLDKLPTLEAVFVSGSLAVNNTPEDDDIDLMCVVKPGTIWVSRFLCVLITQILGVRRNVRSLDVKDKVCLNMFVNSDSMMIVRDEQDAYVAHELLQIVEVFDKNNIRRRYLTENKWVKSIFPIKYEKELRRGKDKTEVINNNYHEIRRAGVLKYLERFFRYWQLWYMRGHRTSEKISDSVLRFHPRDARKWIMPKWREKLDKYKIPLDSIFLSL